MDKNAVICNMNILLVAATTAEIQPAVQYLEEQWSKSSSNIYTNNKTSVEMLITGVGMMATAYSLGATLQLKNYDFALQCGIAGSFDRNIPLGTVLAISSEQMGDLGAEDHDEFIDIYELGLLGENDIPFTNKKLEANVGMYAKYIDLPQVEGLTVNTVSGKQATIDRLRNKYNCQIESMEGAAFHYACLKQDIPFAQVRAISNYIEPRNRENWQLGKAVNNLNNWLITFIENIKENNF
jgi:futalosine hydrolase